MAPHLIPHPQRRQPSPRSRQHRSPQQHRRAEHSLPRPRDKDSPHGEENERAVGREERVSRLPEPQALECGEEGPPHRRGAGKQANVLADGYGGTQPRAEQNGEARRGGANGPEEGGRRRLRASM